VVLVVCISGYDDTDVLRGCLQSYAHTGWGTIYVDGSFELFHEEGNWASPPSRLKCALDGFGVLVVPAPAHAPWPDEASKRTAALDYACGLREVGQVWALFLDTDERLEVDGVDALVGFLEVSDPEALWGSVNIYRPEHSHHPNGHGLPRLLRLVDGMEFRPPRDFDVWYQGGFLVSPNVGGVGAHVEVPRELLRIRHDRHERPAARKAQMGRYCQRRRARWGVA
jgi:hypothetical protein